MAPSAEQSTRACSGNRHSTIGPKRNPGEKGLCAAEMVPHLWAAPVHRVVELSVQHLLAQVFILPPRVREKW